MFQVVYNLIMIISFIVGAHILVTIIKSIIKEIIYKQSDYYKQTKISYQQLINDKEETNKTDNSHDNIDPSLNELKGAYQEYQICNILNNTIKGENNKIYRNVYIPKKYGTSEIDVLYITPMGIFVIESKNINAFIFGSEKDYKWTCTYKSGTHTSMYNPIIQNKNHVKYLQQYLDVPNFQFKSIIVFNNKTVFKKIPSSTKDYKICHLKDLPEVIYNLMIEYDYSISSINVEKIEKNLITIINASDELKERHKTRIKNQYDL